MSVFAPMDPRGPDQRRKQLVAKLAQQAAATHGAMARVPMPGVAGPSMSEGRAFGGRTQTTQAPNILQSVLARLGVVGKSHAEEVSAGHGLPIAPPAHGVNLPNQPMGSAIPTPAQAVGPGVPAQAGPTIAETPRTAPGAAEYNGYDAPLSGGAPALDPGFGITDSGPVPLGNGLFYDPATGTILGQQAGALGGAARSLSGRVAA